MKDSRFQCRKTSWRRWKSLIFLNVRENKKEEVCGKGIPATWKSMTKSVCMMKRLVGFPKQIPGILKTIFPIIWVFNKVLKYTV